MNSRTASGLGIATLDADGNMLDVWFPSVSLGDADESAGQALSALQGADPVRGVSRVVVKTTSDLDAPPADVADVYLRLHALSHRLIRPHEANLSNIFAILHTTVWTDLGPCSAVGFDATRLRILSTTGRAPGVHSIDKIPRMSDYVVPSEVRVADANRVRLGAYLSAGTTIMHEGFVNYNAGTLGAAMVEGRISQGVVVGDSSDIGGGASIMGTLSGGGTRVISIGARSLLGANAGIGISLGDDCIVEAGLYITAGTKLHHKTADGQSVVVKGADLSGVNELLFRRNSLTGAVEAIDRKGTGISLNESLHHN